MNQIDILKNVLKNEGLRYTQQRQIIWDEIRSSTEHRDAEEIYLIIKKKIRLMYPERLFIALLMF
ncbi:hypothetical protein CM15mP5_0860 [bacterium]|nr:MAG: hypothetical protein CM15mP5_0860 [bacterium]